MPPKTIKNVVVMITNVGMTCLEQNSYEEEPFLDRAKCAMKLLIEKKIFLQPRDEVGIITMGDETDNSENLDYIKVYDESLLVPNWEMVKYIDNLCSMANPTNWIEALHVAISIIRREVIDPECQVFVVLIHNFKEDDESINQYDPEGIIEDLKSCGDMYLLFVGENPLNDDTWRIAHASVSENVAYQVMNESDGQYEQIDSFIEQRRFYVPPPPNASAWKCNLEIAGIILPCSTYVKISGDVKIGSWSMKAVKDSEDLLNAGASDASDLSGSSRVVRENIKLDAQRNEVTADKIINGYKFGGQYIPVSEEDEIAMKYAGGPKSLCVYGFVPHDQLIMEHWCGKGSRIIIPQKEEDCPAFYSFAQALMEKDYVAIVRKVYANNSLPRMGVLFPKLEEDEIWCLVHLELPYADEIRVVPKQTITSLPENITEEKLSALDNWIDSMTASDEDMMYLNPGFFPNIPHQYHWNAMADRALNPEKPLIQLPEYLRKYLIPPEKLSRAARPHLEKLNKLFGWSNEEIEKKKKTAAAATKRVGDVPDNILNEKDKAVPTEKNSTDEGVFSPEDLDFANLDDE